MIITMLREGGNVHSLSGVREARVTDGQLFITADHCDDLIVESLKDVRTVQLCTTTGVVVMDWTST